jgi:uncharacterized protein (TIGR02271 family)
MALNENITDDNRLEELGGSNYEIVDGEPNIKGWEVKDEVGKKIGEVDELLFNPQSGSVRYLVVDLNDNELELENADRKVLIPIGLAQLHSEETEDKEEHEDDEEDRSLLDRETGRTDIVNQSTLNEDETDLNEYEEGENRETSADEDESYDPADDEDVVIIPNVTAGQLYALPTYEKDNVTPQMEADIRGIFEGLGLAGTPIVADDFYNHEHFNEDRFYNNSNAEEKLPVIKEDLNIGKREVETGGARITSRLVERPIAESINLKEEHVNVERTPVNRPVTDADQAFQENEIELTEHAEVPVVSKEARVVEEISLNKEVSEKEETIRDTVRNTEVDIEQLPGKETGDNYNRDRS